MTMHDWIGKLDDFLRASGRELLDHAGKIANSLLTNFPAIIETFDPAKVRSAPLATEESA